MEKNNILDSIELTEEQAQAFVEKLNEWKSSVEKNNSIRLKFFEDEIRQKLEEKYGSLFEEAKDRLQSVYSSRLEEAIKSLYSSMRESVIKEWKESPEYKAFEAAKEIFAPLVVEKGIKETVELKESEAMMWKKKAEKVEAENKLKSLLGNLPENVASKLGEIIGDVSTVDEAVAMFNKAVKIMGLTKSALEEEGFVKIEENMDPTTDPTERPLPSGDSKYEEKKKKSVKKRVDESEEDEDEDAEGYDDKDESDGEEIGEGDDESDDGENEESEEDEESEEEQEEDEESEEKKSEDEEDDDDEDKEDGEDEDYEDDEEPEGDGGKKKAMKLKKSKKTRGKSDSDDVVESIFSGDWDGDVITEGDQTPPSIDRFTMEKLRIKQLAGDF